MRHFAAALLAESNVSLTLREDRGFLATHDEFSAWASGRKEFRMEWFYRDMRRKHGILMAPNGEAYDASGATGEACGMRGLADTLTQVRDHGRVHHIARLMVQCNFATLLGVEPAALSRWYWSAFTDAYEWVELPNVIGMGTFGDGGTLATKPYVSSGAYIKRMSNYCGQCQYDVNKRNGHDACPMNTLYWDFLAHHRERFATHPRMRMMLTHLDAMPAQELVTIRAQAAAFRESLTYDRGLAAASASSASSRDSLSTSP